MDEEIDKLLDSQIDFWMPAEGEKLIGELAEVRENQGRHGSNVYVIKTIDALKALWGSSVIDEHLKNAKIGDKVGLKFLGVATSKLGAKYKNFKVVVLPKEDAPQAEA